MLRRVTSSTKNNKKRFDLTENERYKKKRFGFDFIFNFQLVIIVKFYIRWSDRGILNKNLPHLIFKEKRYDVVQQDAVSVQAFKKTKLMMTKSLLWKSKDVCIIYHKHHEWKQWCNVSGSSRRSFDEQNNKKN